MAGIEDAIREYQKRGVKSGKAGLGSPQLSPELLKALNVGGKRVGLGGLFPKGVPGATSFDEGQQRYQDFLKNQIGIDKDKLDPSNRGSRFTEGLQNITDFSFPSLFALQGDAEKLLTSVGDPLTGSPLLNNLGQYVFGEQSDSSFAKDPDTQSAGQDILRQLSAQDRMQKGQLSPVVRDAAEKQKLIDAGIDTFKGGTGENFKKDPTGEFSDPEADALIAQQELDKKADEIAKDAVLAAQDDAEENSGQDLPLTEAQKKAQAQQSLFKSAMDDITNIYGDGTKKDTSRKTIDEYKTDFAKATGIDVSGEPDNKLALMSLGLSLMQNKAGKDFNLSNIIGSAGEAGQAAMPLFQKAKDDARAGQVAAGKYALQETKADSLAKLATAKEKRKALSALSTQFRDEKFKRQLEYIKHNNNMEIKIAEANFKPIDAKGKVTTQTLQGNNFLKVDTAFITGSKNRVFLAPVQQAEKHANMYVNVLEAQGSITEMQNILKSVGQKGGGSAFSLLGGRVKEFLKPLGIGDTDYSKGIDEIVSDKNISAEAKVTAIQDRLISQYKKFLTKESGNGVSEGDIKRLELLVSRIKLGQPIDQNINRLEELRTIFDAPQRTLEGQFNSFSKRENFRNDEEYNKTMAIINKAISTGTDNTYSSSIKNGVFTIDLRKK